MPGGAQRRRGPAAAQALLHRAGALTSAECAACRCGGVGPIAADAPQRDPTPVPPPLPALPRAPALQLLPPGPRREGHPLRPPDFAVRPLLEDHIPRVILDGGPGGGAGGRWIWGSEYKRSLQGLRDVVRLAGATSPPHPLTLGVEERRRARIPQGATQYVWAYPADLQGLERRILAGLDAARPAAGFVQFGGYAYLDAQGAVLGVNAVAPGPGLHFDGPFGWRPEFTAALLAVSPPYPVTIDSLSDLGAKRFAWIPPASATDPGFVLTDSAGRHWADWPHGAFVYFFGDDPLVPHPADCYIRLETVNRIAVPEGKFHHASLHQRSEWVGEHFQSAEPRRPIQRRASKAHLTTQAVQWRTFDTLEEAGGHLAAAEGGGRAETDPDFHPHPRRILGAGWRWSENFAIVALRDLYPPGTELHVFQTETQADVLPDDITQGVVKDCWVLGSFAAIAEEPQLVRRCFPKAAESPPVPDYAGVVTTLLCVDGWWSEIAVDTHVPVFRRPLKPGKKGRSWRFKPAIATNRHAKNQLWVPLLEKAIAKSYGSYHTLEGGDPVDALARLTGHPIEKFPGKQYGVRMATGEADFCWNRPETYASCPDELSHWLGPLTQKGQRGGSPFDRLLELDGARGMMCVYTYDSDAILAECSGGLYTSHHAIGLVPEHVYSLLALARVPLSRPWTDKRGNTKTELRLCRLRNPHGRNEWKGDWSDNSSLWQQYQEVAEALNSSGDPAYRHTGEDIDDGLFWMEWDDVMAIFEGGGVALVQPPWWKSLRFRACLGGLSESAVCALRIDAHFTSNAAVTLYRKDERGTAYHSSGYDLPMLLEIWGPSSGAPDSYEVLCRSNNGRPSDMCTHQVTCWYQFMGGPVPYYVRWFTPDDPAQNPLYSDGFETGVIALQSEAQFATVTPLGSLGPPWSHCCAAAGQGKEVAAEMQTNNTADVRRLRQGQRVDLRHL